MPQRWDDTWQILVERAQQAIQLSYAPYSNYHVGCACLLEDGTILQGANVENASFPLSMCAERIALYTALMQHPAKVIRRLCILSKPSSLLTPCGACRQVLFEIEWRQQTAISILCYKDTKHYHIYPSAHSLLPDAFSPSILSR